MDVHVSRRGIFKCIATKRPSRIRQTFFYQLVHAHGTAANRNGQLTLRTMLSLEPATVTQRFYPLLFQQGETAFGRPINDGQHPHDFIMELAALYDLRLGAQWIAFVLCRAGWRSCYGAECLCSSRFGFGRSSGNARPSSSRLHAHRRVTW